MQWFEKALKPYVQRVRREHPPADPHAKDEFLLLMDNLDCQTSNNPDFIKACLEEGIRIYNYPPQCTDLVQGVDAGLGREIKRQISMKFDEWLDADEKNLAKWEEGLLTASERRILMTMWLGEAFDYCIKNLSIRRYWEKTGSLMSIDSSGDHLITPEGTENYDYHIGEMPNEAISFEAKLVEPIAPANAIVADDQDDEPNERDVDVDENEDDNGELDDNDRNTDAEDDIVDLADMQQDGESDDEYEKKMVDVVPPSMEIVQELPQLDNNSIVGKKLLFRWKNSGWSLCTVKQRFSKNRMMMNNIPRNFELSCDGFKQDHFLQLDKYCCIEANSQIGSWCVLQLKKK